MDEGKLRKVSGRLFGDAPESATTMTTTATTTHAAPIDAAGECRSEVCGETPFGRQ